MLMSEQKMSILIQVEGIRNVISRNQVVFALFQGKLSNL